MIEKWNERFASSDYFYGTEPNEFFKAELLRIPVAGKALLLGDGEGRNSVFAAANGWDVTAIDWSETAKSKAEALAKLSGITIRYDVADLRMYDPGENQYDLIGLIFVHLDEIDKSTLHEKIVRALKPGGRVVIEVYDIEQLKRTSGGPKDPALLYTLEEVATDFIGLDFDTFAKSTVFLNEGPGHKGEAEVIRFTGIKQSPEQV